MNQNLTDLTGEQGKALLDLVVLAMYADGHLTLLEDTRLDHLLKALGYEDPYDRQKEFDAAVTRIRQFAEAPERTRAHAAQLAEHFTNHDQQRQIYALLEEVITSDAHITAGESQLLEVVRTQFRL